MDETFTTILSNKKSVPLCPGGNSKKVTLANYKEFIELTMEARLKESAQQMKWVKEGITEIIDMNILSSLNWSELERRASGGEIDTDALKSITDYEGASDDSEIIKFFWEIFDNFTQEDRKMYLKFIWGRSKLPPDLKGLMRERKHVICVKSYWDNDRLPESHTCFMTLDTPSYSTKEKFEEKLKMAMLTCGEIDND